MTGAIFSTSNQRGRTVSCACGNCCILYRLLNPPNFGIFRTLPIRHYDSSAATTDTQQVFSYATARHTQQHWLAMFLGYDSDGLPLWIDENSSPPLSEIMFNETPADSDAFDSAPDHGQGSILGSPLGYSDYHSAMDHHQAINNPCPELDNLNASQYTILPNENLDGRLSVPTTERYTDPQLRDINPKHLYLIPSPTEQFDLPPSPYELAYDQYSQLHSQCGINQLNAEPQAIYNDISTNPATSAILWRTESYSQSDPGSDTSDVLQREILYGDPGIDQAPQEEMDISHERSQLAPTRETASKSAPPRQRSKQVPSKNCDYPKCTRRFRPTAPNMRFCIRHQKNYDRNNAPPPKFELLPDIDSGKARKTVYPTLLALNLEHDDVGVKSEKAWVFDFINAANKPYIGPSEYHEFYARQQKVYNGKGFDEFLDEPTVNVRMRLLYQAARTFHEGGEAVYPIGGDNDGYGNADETMIFSERLKVIISLLETNKRVCMDVIEGRGVAALVANPKKYAKRKTQNKDSNERKQKMQKLGEEQQMKDEGKSFEVRDVYTEDYSDDGEEVVEEDGNETSLVEFPMPALTDLGPDADPDDVLPTKPAQLRTTKRKRQTRSVAADTSDERSAKLQKLLPKGK